MGGFGAPILRALESAAEKSPIAHEAAEAIVGKYSENISSMRSNLNTTKGGRVLTELLEKHVEPLYQKNLQKASQQQLNYFQQGSNVQGPMQPSWHAKIKARNDARATVGGKNDSVFAGVIKHIEKNDGHEKAQYAVDAMGSYFHEMTTPDIKFTPGGKPVAAGTESSQFVKNLAKNKGTKDVLYSSSQYKPPTGTKGSFERGLGFGTSAALAPKAAIMHISQQFNMPLDQSVSSYLKALGSIAKPGGWSEAKFYLEHAGAVGSIASDELSAMYARRYGSARYLPKGRVGDWIARNFAIPGMPFIKELNSIVAGRQAMYRAGEIADTLAKGGPTAKRAAISDAKRLGLDWQKLEANGLQKSDVETAMFHHINNTVFNNSPLNRSLYALNSPMGRSMTMFHNYALQQSNLIYNVMKRTLVEKHDPVSVIKFFAMMGVVAPAIGEGLEEIKNLATGKDWDDPAGHYTDRMGEFYSTNDFNGKLMAMSHVAGYGLLVPYIRASGRYKLAQAIMGPQFSTGFEFVEDLQKGVESDNWDQVGRDILHDIPSVGVGAVMSNLLLPRDTRHSRSRKRSRTRRR